MVIRPEFLGFLVRHLQIFLGVGLIAVLERPGRPRLHINYLERIRFDEILPRRFSSNRIHSSNLHGTPLSRRARGRRPAPVIHARGGDGADDDECGGAIAADRARAGLGRDLIKAFSKYAAHSPTGAIRSPERTNDSAL